jgi:hypothetical protein
MSASVMFKDLALPMAANNVPVIRLQPKSKIPMDKAWQILATTDVDKILAWDKETPNANCACVAQSDGVLFFETDEPGVVGRYEEETGEMFPETFAVQSREDRYHFYFLQTQESRKCGSITQKEIPFGSLRQNNAYVVAAGSIHPTTGLPYTILNDSPIVPVPTKLLEWLQAQVTKTSTAVSLAASKAPIPLGQHDVTLTAIAGKLRQDGLEYDEIEAVLIRTCEQRCEGYGSDYVEMCKKIAKSICRYPAGDSAPTLLIGGKLPGAAKVEEAHEASKSKEELAAEAYEALDKRKQEFEELQSLCEQEQAATPNPYPNDAWEGTPYLEFARLCRSEGDPKFQNYLPTEFGINALMTVVGAICGHRIRPDFDDQSMDARFYTVLLTPRGGSGKGTIFKFTKSVFAGSQLIYTGNKVFNNIGTFTDDFASARGLTESFQVHPSILQVYEELSTPFEKFGIAGSGTSFKDLNLRLFDSTDPQNSRKQGTKVPENAPIAIHNSLLGSTTTEKGRWDEMFSSSNDDTLRQRLNIIPSEEDRRVVAIKQPDFTELRRDLLNRIGLLNSYKLIWSYSPEAWELLTNWYQQIDEAAREAGDNDEREALGRIQVHIHRVIAHLALWLAPLPPDVTTKDLGLFDGIDDSLTDWLNGIIGDETEPYAFKAWNVTVPADWMRRAIRIAEHQIQARRDHTPPEGLSPVALCENLIKKHMGRKKTTRWFSLVRAANLDKYGHDIRIKALFNAAKERAIRVDANPEDKDNQSEWVITWLGRGWNASWKETRGGKRSGAGRKPKA